MLVLVGPFFVLTLAGRCLSVVCPTTFFFGRDWSPGVPTISGLNYATDNWFEPSGLLDVRSGVLPTKPVYARSGAVPRLSCGVDPGEEQSQSRVSPETGSNEVAQLPEAPGSWITYTGACNRTS